MVLAVFLGYGIYSNDYTDQYVIDLINLAWNFVLGFQVDILLLYIGYSASVAYKNPSLLMTRWHHRVADNVFFQVIALFISDFSYLIFVYTLVFAECMWHIVQKL